jgi:DNA-binding GntR family transcriptional regulator
VPLIVEKMPPPKTLRGRIIERVEEAILSGSLAAGERLVERKLAEQFSTSTTVVREALIELEAQGFVMRKTNSATYVTKLSREAAEKIFAFRKIVETYAVEEAARLATPQQIRHLEELYWALLEAARSQDTSRFMRSDFALHEAIWKIPDNEYVTLTLKRILLPIFSFTAIRIFSSAPFDLLQDANSHLPLLEAIKSKNPEAARSAFLAAADEWLSKTRAYVFPESAEK